MINDRDTHLWLVVSTYPSEIIVVIVPIIVVIYGLYDGIYDHLLGG